MKTYETINDILVHLFNEIWVLSEANINDLEVEYRAKFPNDPLSVVREILVYILEATVTEKRRRLMMEIMMRIDMIEAFSLGVISRTSSSV